MSAADRPHVSGECALGLVARGLADGVAAEPSFFNDGTGTVRADEEPGDLREVDRLAACVADDLGLFLQRHAKGEAEGVKGEVLFLAVERRRTEKFDVLHPEQLWLSQCCLVVHDHSRGHENEPSIREPMHDRHGEPDECPPGDEGQRADDPALCKQQERSCRSADHDGHPDESKRTEEQRPGCAEQESPLVSVGGSISERVGHGWSKRHCGRHARGDKPDSDGGRICVISSVEGCPDRRCCSGERHDANRREGFRARNHQGDEQCSPGDPEQDRGTAFEQFGGVFQGRGEERATDERQNKPDNPEDPQFSR